MQAGGSLVAGCDLVGVFMRSGFLLSLLLVGMPFVSGDADALTRSDSFVVRNDHGGYVVDYAISMVRLQQSHRPVVFSGRCDSACTIYLGLSASQVCLLPSARFGFHLPFGSSQRGNRGAAGFLMKKYPAWVRTWIRANGGLTSQLKVMNYEYARRFMKPCNLKSNLL